MRIVRRTLAVVLAIILVAPAAHAQQQPHAISSLALEAAVQERVSQEQSDREAILTLLQRDDVRQIAAQAGISLEKAQAAVSTLDGETLRDLASQARAVQHDLAGGASAVVISTTTIIIILLLVLLIVVIAD